MGLRWWGWLCEVMCGGAAVAVVWWWGGGCGGDDNDVMVMMMMVVASVWWHDVWAVMCSANRSTTSIGRSLVSSDVYYEVTPPDTFPLRHIFGGVTIGALVKACYRSEVSAQVKVDAYRLSNLTSHIIARLDQVVIAFTSGDTEVKCSIFTLCKCKRKICDGHYSAAFRVLSSSGVAPYNNDTLEDLKSKHHFKPAPSLPHISIDHHHLIASPTVVLDRIKSFPRGTYCGWDGLHAQHLMDCLSGAAVAISNELVSSITQVVNLFLDGNCPKILGEYIASAPLTPLVKPGGGIRPIVVGTVWRRLVSKFGVGVSGGGEAILHVVNRLIEGCRDDIGLSMLLVDFKNAFNLVDREVMLEEVRLRCPAISRWVEFCYSSPARLYYGEHTLWSCQEVQHGDLLGPLLFYLVLHPLICKISDSFSLSLQAWYLDDGTFIGDTLVVGKVLELTMEDGPRCGLHLNVNKTEVFWPKEDPRSRLVGVFPPNIAWLLHGVKLLGGPASVDFNFSSELVMKRVAKTIVLMETIAKINDPQCELLLLRACADISKLYFAMRTCSPQVFEMAQRSFDAALRSTLECIVTAYGPGFGHWQWRLATLPFAFGGLGVYCVAFGPAFNDALCVFNTKMETDLLSNASEIAAPKLMKKLADIYFTRVTQTAESTFSLSSRQMALWQSQMEDHASDWLRAVPISGLGQTMNAGKEVDIGLGGGCDKPLSPADMLLYSWDEGLDVCADFMGSSPLTQTGMVDFVPGRAVTDAAHRKRVKYEAKCANIEYGFLPFSFSSLGELEKDAVNLLKRI
ncbi:putative reverse transcriptase domain-containing protein [Tanacetum coccineum]